MLANGGAAVACRISDPIVNIRGILVYNPGEFVNMLTTCQQPAWFQAGCWNTPGGELMPDIRDIWLHAHHMLRNARQIVNANLRPLRLSSAEGNILLHLLTQGEEMGQEELVEQLDISKPAVSRTLDSLEAKGFVRRLPDPKDRRVHRVQLTAQARAIGPAVEQAYNQLYAVAMQGITPQELEDFLRLFGRMSANFARAQQASAPGEGRVD